MVHNWRRSAALSISKQVYICSRLHDLWTLLNLFLYLADCQSVTMPALLPSSAQQSAKNKLQNRLNLINRTTLKKKDLPIYRQVLWSGKRDSNPRPPAWKASALSTELFPHKSGQ